MLVLSIVGHIFLYLLLILFVILLAFLVIPFRYYFTGEKQESSWFLASFSWLFDGIKININYNSGKLTSNIRFLVFDKKIERGQNQKKDSDEEGKERWTKKPKSKDPYSYLTYSVLRKGLECLIKFFNHCKPETFRMYISGGFDDPMITGLLCAIRGAGAAILNKYSIRIQTNFEEEELKGNLTLKGRIRLIYILFLTIEFILAEPFRSIFVKNLKIKIKRRLRTWQSLILRKT